MRARTSFFALTALCATVLTNAAVRAAGEEPQLWSLQPVRQPEPPAVKDTGWPINPIDRFVLRRLESRGLKPSGSADQTTLIRRLTFDLIGLPPTPAEVDAFVNDKDPRAYDRLVDRLLASPHYGERWARHWLDCARFSESQGFERDKLRPNAWHYRDYVIRAFNENKPYDRFIIEQIAGDALTPVTADGIVATALLVCGAYDEVGAGQQSAVMKARVREEELEDIVSVVSQTFLGMTANCARCHDHKFAPISQVDYFRIKSVFEGVRHGERKIVDAAASKRHAATIAKLNAQLKPLQDRLAALNKTATQRVLAKQTPDKPETDRPLGPRPFAHWSFENGSTRDTVGQVHGELKGGAKIESGRLVLNGSSAFFQTSPLSKDIREKTLEAWVVLPTLNQGGGGAITLESGNGVTFDSIVYGERQPRKWMAGSDFFRRTNDLTAPQESTQGSQPNDAVHMAIVYGPDNAITVYRNGQPYAATYKKHQLQSYKAGDARVLLGKRHTGSARSHLNGQILSASLYDRPLSAGEVQASYKSAGRFLHVYPADLLAALTPQEQAEHKRLTERVAKLAQQLQAVPSPQPFTSYTGVRRQPPPTRLLDRGDVTKPRQVVSPGAMSVIGQPTPDFKLKPDAPEAQRRLALARWIAHHDNPLTARVMVNRVWHYHFGRGIVATPNDFGESGAKPTHPQLLDWLAAHFVESGWDVKALHKLIVTSAAYRQSSDHNDHAMQVDAGNTLVWRFKPRRLEGEAVRDAVLSVSGLLNKQMGGPSFRPFDVVVNNTHFYHVKDKPGPQFDRRTIYRINVSSGKDPLLDVLDCPDPSVKAPLRRSTTTPRASLMLMNGPFMQRQFKAFAKRVTDEANGDQAKAVDLAFRYAIARRPTDMERRTINAFLERESFEHLCWVILNMTEFVYVR